MKGEPRRFVVGHATRLPPPVEDPRTGCLIWQGASNSTGRGRTMVGGKVELAYRVWFERARGTIPDGCELHHTCGDPMCVNPDHLEPMTPADHAKLHRAEMRCAQEKL